MTEGERDSKKTRIIPGKLPLFSNVDEHGRWRSRFRTFLIDSSQLESGEALSDDFRKVAAREIEEFEKEKQARGESIDDLKDADLLREVMNTIGRPGRLGVCPIRLNQYSKRCQRRAAWLRLEAFRALVVHYRRHHKSSHLAVACPRWCAHRALDAPHDCWR